MRIKVFKPIKHLVSFTLKTMNSTGCLISISNKLELYNKEDFLQKDKKRFELKPNLEKKK